MHQADQAGNEEVERELLEHPSAMNDGQDEKSLSRSVSERASGSRRKLTFSGNRLILGLNLEGLLCLQTLLHGA